MANSKNPMAPQKQSLAIALNMKRMGKKKPKKMAEGGEVSANDQKRPMPENLYHDEDSVKMNRGNKPLKSSQWDDSPTVRDAQDPSPAKPSMPPLSLGEDQDDVMDERDLQSSESPGPYGEQPKSRLNEVDPNRHGSDPDMSMSVSDSIVRKRKMMAEGGWAGSADEESAEASSLMGDTGRHGKMSENDNLDEPAGLEEDDDQMGPPSSEYMDGNMRPQFAEGGEVDEDGDQTISDVIMKRRREQMNPDQSGMVDLDALSEEEPNQYVPIDGKVANEMRYDDSQISPQPENSNQKGDELSDEDEHNESLLSAIRKKMRAKRSE
jgi:hypothetical protein